jgi:cobalt-zinc-cadmium efflux system protein
VLEAGYGFATDSLALLSDALHNLGDVLGLGWPGARPCARERTDRRHTYGWRRATCCRRWPMRCCWSRLPARWRGKRVRRFARPPEIPPLPVMSWRRSASRSTSARAGWCAAGHDHDLNRRGASCTCADARCRSRRCWPARHAVAGMDWLDP